MTCSLSSFSCLGEDCRCLAVCPVRAEPPVLSRCDQVASEAAEGKELHCQSRVSVFVSLPCSSVYTPEQGVTILALPMPRVLMRSKGNP